MRCKDFRTQIRAIYRACRRKYGIKDTQRECLRVFHAAYPLLCELRQSDAEYGQIDMHTRTELYRIIRDWKPQKQLQKVIERAESWIDIPFECPRTELIQFLNDIMPVREEQLTLQL